MPDFRINFYFIYIYGDIYIYIYILKENSFKNSIK